MKLLSPKVVSPLIPALVTGAVALAVASFVFIQPTVDFAANGDSGTITGKLVDQLIFMSIIALFVERAVETYLVASGIHDERVVDKLTNTEYRLRPIGPYALTGGAIVSSLVALSGVRLLEAGIDYETASCTGKLAWDKCGTYLLGATDIVLTVGLLAAGSAVLHDIVNLIPTLAGRMNNFVAGTPHVAAAPKKKVLLNSADGLDQVRQAIAYQTFPIDKALTHTIRIDRGPGSSGVLYQEDSNGKKMDFPCRWDPENRIAAGTFPRCSRTIMATKKRPAIHMPGTTLHGKPNNNIFIHRGRDESWSDGCFVLDDDHMAKLLAAIPDENAFNITVTVRDI